MRGVHNMTLACEGLTFTSLAGDRAAKDDSRMDHSSELCQPDLSQACWLVHHRSSHLVQRPRARASGGLSEGVGLGVGVSVRVSVAWA